jgi:hypothetical protein
MREEIYESAEIVVLTVSPTDIITSSFGGNTPLEDEEW